MSATRTHAKSDALLRIKRAYAPVERDDGLRVLVDRLWPRGLTKEKAHIDLWLKDIAPSNALRHLVHDDPEQWDTFVAAYARELAAEPAKSAVALLREKIAGGPVTLVYAARNEGHNNAVALRDWLHRHST
jgi:uncharacterized protein YeaO (DUF488 family)